VLYSLEGVSPQLGEGAWIAPSAEVIGRVELGAQASVWFNCVLRGDSDRLIVGAGSNVQDASVLHTDSGIELRIGKDCTIGHQVMLHGCTIGDNSLVGIQSVILNRAVIGANSLVAAGSLVPEGKVFPDGVMLMGAPAKVVRPLSPVEIQIIKASAQHYRQNAERFRQGLKPLA
jgi:carbonic anhydrase/acetyltransferase-like protein (isoleucine patch superfamily)